MAKILCIESATKVCSVALFENDELLGYKEQDGDYSHSEKLAVFIHELLKENQVKVKQLDAVAVSKGPGSYTGLRIGVSLAKGLCFSLNIPLIAIETLKAMASKAINSLEKPQGLFCPMIDARRMEVYSEVFDPELNVKEKIKATVVDENSFSDYLKGKKLYFFGDGAAKCRTALTHENAIFLDNILPSATALGKLAFEKFKTQAFEDVAYFEPYYLKEFIALKSKKLV